MSRLKYSMPSSWFVGLTLSLAMLLVASVPFGHALEIHHIFSAIDHDGHQHSDSDLCQWVQQHTSTSLAWDHPHFAQRSWLYTWLSHVHEYTSSSFPFSLLDSR